MLHPGGHEATVQHSVHCVICVCSNLNAWSDTCMASHLWRGYSRALTTVINHIWSTVYYHKLGIYGNKELGSLRCKRLYNHRDVVCWERGGSMQHQLQKTQKNPLENPPKTPKNPKKTPKNTLGGRQWCTRRDRACNTDHRCKSTQPDMWICTMVGARSELSVGMLPTYLCRTIYYHVPGW